MPLFASENRDEFYSPLVEHFNYLADTPGYQEVLGQLMKNAQLVVRETFGWRIVFKEGEEWERKEIQCGEPLAPTDVDEIPEYHRLLVTPHRWLRVITGYDSCELNKGREYEDDPEWGHVPAEFRAHLPNLLAPIQSGSNFVFYHPTDRNAQSLPILCYTSSKKIESTSTLNPGAYVLKWMAEEFNISLPASATK